MGRIPDETIQAIRDRVDLVELIGRYVALRPAGRNHKGLCPFHDEKTPSFNVNADRQIFHCFGCGAGGNAFTFLTRHENLTFPEAVRELGRQVGIEVAESDSREAGLYEKLREVGDVAQAWFRAELASPRGAGARDYLARRGLEPEVVEAFGIGFAPDRWDGLVEELRRRRIDAGLGLKAGVLAERRSGGHYDRLRGRVTFPIRDARGRILGFGGRVLDPEGEPKYLNGPETPIYKKREVVFGFPLALEPMRRSGRAVVCEGYFDVVALHRAGVAEAVATCGTALTPEHARDLKRRTREVVLLFDGDEAGRRAARSALEVLLPVGLRVRDAALPPGEDPDTLLAHAGPDSLKALVDDAAPALEVQIADAARQGLATPWERADAVHAVAPLIALVNDPVERGEFARLLAMRTGVREEDVDAAVRGAGRGGPRDEEEASLPAPRRRGPEDRWLASLASAVLDQPSLAAEVPLDEIASLLPEAATGPAFARLVSVLAAGGDPDGELDGEAHAFFTELAAAEREPQEEDGARRVLRETLENLRKRSHRRERRDSTRAATQAGSDEQSLLSLKEEQLRRRRQLHKLPPGPDTVRH
jgi:DNA primase